ncbi:hypothetical protein [Thiomonas sp.]
MQNKSLMEKIDAIIVLSSMLVWVIPTAIIWSAPTSEVVHPGTGLLFPLFNLPVMYLLYAMARSKRLIPVAPCRSTGVFVSMAVFLFMAIMRDFSVLYGIYQFTLLITIIGSLATIYYLLSVLPSFYDINYIGWLRA